MKLTHAIIICSFLTIEWMIFSVLIFFFTIIYSFKVVNIKYIFSIVGLSWVPIIIKTFSYLILIIINDEIFAPQGLTIFFNDLPEIAKVTLQNLDIFVLWQLLIIYFGVNIITKKKLLSSLIVLTTFSITILIKIFPYILATTIMN